VQVLQQVLNAVIIFISCLLLTRVHEAFAKATVSLVMSAHPFVCIPYGTARLTRD
jgi:hypothetical protein